MATTKKTETKTAPKETKETVKATPVTEVKAEVKAVEEPAKKAAPKKATPAKKAPAKEIKSKVYVQYGDLEVSTESLLAAAKKACGKAGYKAADIKTLDVYVKPEEGAAYYVVNGTGSEEYKIFL